VTSATRLSSGQNGIPPNFTSTNNELGIASAAIGDWDGNGYGDFASSAPGANTVHIFLMGSGNVAEEVISMNPESEGYGYAVPSAN